MNYVIHIILFVSILIFGCSQQTKKEANINNEAYKNTMDRLIEDVWNNQNLDILAEVFTEDAELHLGGLDYNLKGIQNFRENYMRTTMNAFPDIQHGYDQLIVDGNRIAMMFYGEGTHKGEYDGIPATNKVLRYRGMAFFRMEDYRIAEVWTHSNWSTKFANLTK